MLTTIYKNFLRSHLDYGDVRHDQAFSNTFHERLESSRNSLSGTESGVPLKSKLEQKTLPFL